MLLQYTGILGFITKGSSIGVNPILECGMVLNTKVAYGATYPNQFGILEYSTVGILPELCVFFLEIHSWRMIWVGFYS